MKQSGTLKVVFTLENESTFIYNINVVTFECLLYEIYVSCRKLRNINLFFEEAITALSNYNENPYDLKANNITFSEVYEKWSEEHFEEIVPSAQRTWNFGPSGTGLHNAA